jgi:hypothetical protein
VRRIIQLVDEDFEDQRELANMLRRDEGVYVKRGACVGGQEESRGKWSFKGSECARFVEMHGVMVASEVRETA